MKKFFYVLILWLLPFSLQSQSITIYGTLNASFHETQGRNTNYLIIGNDDLGKKYISCVRFNPSDFKYNGQVLTSNDIESATITLRLCTTPNHPISGIGVYNLNFDWNITSTTYNQIVGYTNGNPPITWDWVGPQAQWYITSIVKQWLDNPQTVFSFAMKTQNTQGYYVNLARIKDGECSPCSSNTCGNLYLLLKQRYTLKVESNKTNVPITIWDPNLRNINTSYSKLYSKGTIISLQAPSSADGAPFFQWKKNGAVYNSNQKIDNLSIDNDDTYTAEFKVSMKPTVATTNITNITSNSASSGGNITDDGGASVTARGVCWSTSQNPTTSDNKTSDGTGTGSFTSSISGLNQNTTYYVRAYATNSVGTAYGSQVEFTTKNPSWIYRFNNITDDMKFELTAGDWQGIYPNKIKAVSSNMNWNNLIQFYGDITIDTISFDITMNGSLWVHINNMPGGIGNGDYVLYKGQFNAKLNGKDGVVFTLLGDIAQEVSKIFGCKIALQNLSIVGGLSATKLIIDGTLEIPKVSQGCDNNENTKIEINGVEISANGITLNNAHLTNLSPHPSICLNELNLQYDPANDYLLIEGNINVKEWFSANGKIEIEKKELKTVIFEVEVTHGIPIGETGLQIVGLKGGLEDLNTLTPKISVGGKISAITDGLFELKLNGDIQGNKLTFDCTANIIKIPTTEDWQIKSTLHGDIDLIDKKIVLKGSMNVVKLNNEFYFVTGMFDGSYRINEDRFSGSFTDGKITIPKQEGFPFDLFSDAGGLPKQYPLPDIKFNEDKTITVSMVIVKNPLINGHWYFKINLNKNPIDKDFFKLDNKIILNSLVRNEIPPKMMKNKDGLQSNTQYDTLNGYNSFSNIYFRLKNSYETPNAFVIDPNGNYHYSTNSDSSIIKHTIGDSILYWIINKEIDGDWIFGIDKKDSNNVNYYGILKSIPLPNFSLTQVNKMVTIEWDTTGLSNNSDLYFYLDNDTLGYDGSYIGTCQENLGKFEFIIDSNKSNCSYYIHVNKNDNLIDYYRYINTAVIIDKNILIPVTITKANFNLIDSTLDISFSDSNNLDVNNYIFDVIDTSGHEEYFDQIYSNERNFLIKLNHTNPKSIKGQVYFRNGMLSCFSTEIPINKINKQLLTLKSGWNMVSSCIEPQLPDSLQFVCADINDNLIIAKNNNGDVYIPSYDINNIGKWDKTQSYQVYMNSDDSLIVTGMAMKPESTPIPLSAGWNMPAYICNSSIDAELAFTSITDDENLIIAKDNEGNVYIPMYGINDIINLVPGQGYQIYVFNDDNLIYPANIYGKSSSSSIRKDKPKILLPKYKNTGSNSTLIIKVEAIDGSEIGVYNFKDEIVGSGIVNNGLAAVTIWGDNLQTKEIDGALNNYELRITNYNVKTGKVSDIQLKELTDFISNEKELDLKYSKDKVYFAKAEVKQNSGMSLNIKPNPASDIIEIEFYSQDCSNTEISIYTSNGNLVDKITDKLKNLSGNTITYNISKLSSGEYTFTMTCGNEKAMRKVVVVR